MSIRTERVNEEIRKVLSERVVRGLRDPLPGFVTIASVDVTSDFSQAKVWVSVIGSEADKRGALEALRHSRGVLRSEVGKRVRLRQTPELHFELDEAGERASRVWQILEEEKRKAAGATAASAVAGVDQAPASVPVEQALAPRSREAPGKASGTGRAGRSGRRGDRGGR